MSSNRHCMRIDRHYADEVMEAFTDAGIDYDIWNVEDTVFYPDAVYEICVSSNDSNRADLIVDVVCGR